MERDERDRGKKNEEPPTENPQKETVSWITALALAFSPILVIPVILLIFARQWEVGVAVSLVFLIWMGYIHATTGSKTVSAAKGPVSILAGIVIYVFLQGFITGLVFWAALAFVLN